MPGEADLVTLAEAAARTGYTVQHLRRLLRTGKIAGRRFGRTWVTTLEAVEVYRGTDPKPGPKPGRRRQ
jgi:excisionase family DNA binding protein